MLTLSELKNLVALGESSSLEFKKSTAEKERACRTLCAFANLQGGVLLFGVSRQIEASRAGILFEENG